MLTYLRNKYQWVPFARPHPHALLTVAPYTRSYCFWCGCQYNDAEDLEENCPGTEEEHQ